MAGERSDIYRTITNTYLGRREGKTPSRSIPATEKTAKNQRMKSETPKKLSYSVPGDVTVPGSINEDSSW